MSETKFTKGPWAWWTSNSRKRLSAGDKDGGVLYAYAFGNGHCDIQVSAENMHLIAAAPELYAVLEQLMTVCTRYGIADFPEIQAEHVAAVLALAKARGELP